MSDTTVRIIILILGVLLLGGIYLWHTRFSAGARRGKAKKEPREAEQRPASRPAPKPGAAPIPGLNQTTDAAGRQVTEFEGFELIEEDVPEGFDMEAMFDPTGASEPAHFDNAASEVAALPDDMAFEDELIVTLYVTAQGETEFAGRDLSAAFAKADMSLGEQNVYHHYGVGKIQSDQPLFTAANMYEPGSFDRQMMDGFKTRGIALFMRLPQPLEGALIFEMLLHSAQRLAGALNGQVLDSRHRPLAEPEIERLRDQVAQFGFEAL